MQLKKHSSFIFALLPVICLGFVAFHKAAPLNPSHSHSSAPLQYQLLYKVPLDEGSFFTDNLQNLYVYSGYLLKKYDPTGKLLFQYDDRSYGHITYIDITDPLKVMLFYRDFPEVVFLDNTLSVNGSPISPADLGFQLTTLACISHDNGAWLYDAQGLQLVRVDMNLNITQKTGNLVQLLGASINPIYMLEYNSYEYVNDSALGIMVFDQFGTYFKTIPIKGLTTFQVRGDDLFYNKGNKVHAFHLKSLMEDVTLAPDSSATSVRIEKNMLFDSAHDTVYAYSMK